MTPVRVCLVGAGRAGAVHARNVRAHTAEAEMAAVVDGDRARAEELAAEVGGRAFSTLAEAVAGAELDAVVIATPTFTHRDLAVEALAAGLHVFCEKPMALSAAECDDMLEAAKAAGRVLQIGYVRRFQPEFQEAKARIEAGEIGDVMLVKSLTRGPGLPPAWAQDLSLSNGMLAEVNSHCFDSVRWMAGSELVRVYAEVANHKGELHGVTADDFYDNAVVSLRFANDAIGTIDGVCPADYGYDARVEVVGTKGLITIGEVNGLPLIVAVDRNRGGSRPVHKTWPERFSWGYVREINGFVDAVLGRCAPAVTGIDGKRAVEAVVASNRSWQEGRPIELAEAAV
ncbi:MAG TPA: Gfo/Idh/MocA family oxidoreductase [Capillimicrobium sp.]|nr:Gfo/Idh/MocA family oxidoreductase [Capillimicrobium sp.]